MIQQFFLLSTGALSAMLEQIHFGLILKLIVLLTLANSSPVLAKKILGDRFSHPIDAGLMLGDGRPLFGPSKTIRGVLCSTVLTSIGSELVGLGFGIGALVAATAMAGDLISSFTKRRLGFKTSSRATGLDQIPEALLPLLACEFFLPLGPLDLGIILVLFVVGDIVLSPLFHLAHIRDEPY
jgi:CDP-2,3-bis-(O-geranylgeranyl)-sn-glycerol synthase